MKYPHVSDIRSLAVVGATGLVGQEFLSLLAEYKVRIPTLRLLASEESSGETAEIGDEEFEVEPLTSESFRGIEAAFFSVPSEVTRKFVPQAIESGALVVDDSSCYRMDAQVPLIVPEINGNLLRNFDGQVIATPNCTTTPLALCLKPLLDRYGVKRVVVSTYQSVSGAGRRAFEALSEEAGALLNGMSPEEHVFPHRLAFNCLPWIGTLEPDGSSDEEAKVQRELRKILDAPSLPVAVTAVRVPTFCGHGAAVTVELEKNFDQLEEVRDLFEATHGVKVIDRPDHHIYPTNQECVGTDATLVGRIRRDGTVPVGLQFWVMADNLRKGAALNALQILETLYRYRKMS